MKLIRSRQQVSKVQRRSAHARGKHSNLFKMRQRVFANDAFDNKRQSAAMTSRECAHQSHIRSFASPTVVRLAIWAIQAESDVRNYVTIQLDHRPDAVEVPSVSDETALHPFGSNCFY